MALKYISRTEQSGGGLLFLFEGNIDELAKNVNDFFLARKYKLKSGNLINAVYEKGNYVLRVLFGVFVTYYKFNVVMKQEEANKVSLYFLKGHSGASGGLIGMAKLKKEYKLIADSLENIDSVLGAYTSH